MCVVEVYISTVCSIPPLLTSSADSLQSDGAILSQKVYGELVMLVSLWKNVSVKIYPSNADHPHHLMLLRKYISRRAAGKGRAVLEGVGLDAPTMRTCFSDHSRNVEEAVQDGLTRWCDGRGFPPIWGVLIGSIQYAGFAQQDINDLRVELGLSGVCACLCASVVCSGVGVCSTLSHVV